jgi:hypothetical protein
MKNLNKKIVKFYLLGCFLFLVGFVYFGRVYMARHDMLQVITEFSMSYGPKMLDLNGLNFNLNLGTPTCLSAELLFGQDPILLLYTTLLKFIGLGPEFVYLSFLLLSQLVNCIFLFLTLRLNNYTSKEFDFALASTFFLSANMFSLMTQGHGEIFLFRYFSIFIYLYLLFLKEPSPKRLMFVIFVLSLQSLGYQGVYSLAASLVFALAQKETYRIGRFSRLSTKFRSVLICFFFGVFFLTLAPLYIAFKTVRTDYVPIAREITGSYSGGVPGQIIFPEIVHGAIYLPFTIFIFGAFCYLANAREKLTFKLDYLAPNFILPLLALTYLSSIKLGSQETSLPFRFSNDTFLGLRNFGFIESAVTYLAYVWALTHVRIYIHKLKNQNLNPKKHIEFRKQHLYRSSSTRSKRIFLFENVVPYLFVIEIVLLTYNQPSTYGFKGRDLPWAQSSEFKFDTKQENVTSWLEFYPFVYSSTGVFLNSSLLTPPEIQFVTEEEKEWCLNCDGLPNTYVPKKTQFFSTWGRSKKVNLSDPFLGDGIKLFLPLKYFDQRYRAQSFWFKDVRPTGTKVTFYPKENIEPIISLNRGGVPNRLLFLDSQLESLLNNSVDLDAISILNTLRASPAFFYSFSEKLHEEMTETDIIVHPGSKSTMSGNRYVLEHLECRAEINGRDKEITVTTTGEGCHGLRIGIRVANANNWVTYVQEQGDERRVKTSDFSGLLLSTGALSDNTKVYRFNYENSQYAVLAFARLSLQLILFFIVLHLVAQKIKRRKIAFAV